MKINVQRDKLKDLKQNMRFKQSCVPILNFAFLIQRFNKFSIFILRYFFAYDTWCYYVY